MRMIYADNAATTKLSPTVLAAMIPYFTEGFGNPSSLYDFGTKARSALEQARADVAQCLNAQTDEIFFTSGGTESDNWGFAGRSRGPRAQGQAYSHLRY